ncbi:hypothetical protein MFLAVUS_005643 [Mucor flavus]|uniref:Uncharacterized protein n=1 Tax=Mucor flavus TaxID=439312 RepID=A0ABP9YZC0_9FUNG
MRTKLTLSNTWCHCSDDNSSTSERNNNTAIAEDNDKKEIKKKLVRLIEEAGQQEIALELKYKMMQTLKEYLDGYQLNSR